MIKFTAFVTCAAIACCNTPCANNRPDTLPDAGVGLTPPAIVQPSTVSAYAQEVARLVNIERAAAGLAPLRLDETLCAAAQRRAEEIDISFSHTRPNGSSSFSVLKEFGFTYRAVGENIAKGSPTPQRVVDGWMNSAGHRANILHERFTTLGVGVYEDAAGTMHWVQIFTA